jgi:hypothetical protein
MEIKSTVVVSGGKLVRFSHQSKETGTPMTCSVFLPATNDPKVPYLLYLSGLTCTDENVCQKSGVFKALAKSQVIILGCCICILNFGYNTCCSCWQRLVSLLLTHPLADLTSPGMQIVGTLALELGFIWMLQIRSGLPTTACIRTSPTSCLLYSPSTSPCWTTAGTVPDDVHHTTCVLHCIAWHGMA